MRLKIIAGNVLWVLATGLIAFFAVRGAIVEQATADVAEEVERSHGVLSRSFRLAAAEFTELVRSRAATPDVATVFNASGTTSLRHRAHQAANGVAAWFQDPARGMNGRPEIVLVTDETGRVLARDLDPERMFDTSLSQSLPVLRDVLSDGRAVHTLWRQRSDNKVLRVVAAPIRSADGHVIGALMVGYDLSNGFAQSQAESVAPGVVGYVIEGRLYSSSGDVAALDAALAEGQPLRAATDAAVGSSQTSSRIELAGGDQEFLAMAGPLAGAHAIPAAMVTVVSRTDRLERASAANIVAILAGVAAFGVFIYSFLIGGSLLRPLEDIEDGVLKVINGRTDFRIDVDNDEFGGLAYRINQLINMLTGVEESDEEGRTTSSGAWTVPTDESPTASAATGGGNVAAGVGAVAGQPADGGDANLAAALAAEPADQYYQRVYNEYIQAKQAAGEDVSNIAPDRFIERLKGQEANLAQKKGCRMVRFQVQVGGGQVSLKPVLIN